MTNANINDSQLSPTPFIMSKSLQQQLLQQGLIDSKKAKAISKNKHNTYKNQNRKKTNADDQSPNKTVDAMEQARREQKARDRQLNLQQKKQADTKAIAAQVLQIIEQYKLDRDEADLEYNFTDANIVKKIPVSKNMSKEISRGRLCIVRLGQSYEVVPKPIADKIYERDDNAVVVANENENVQHAADSDSDDAYYAQFEIPDDLVW